jgi:hypothetical protein
MGFDRLSGHVDNDAVVGGCRALGSGSLLYLRFYLTPIVHGNCWAVPGVCESGLTVLLTCSSRSSKRVRTMVAVSGSCSGVDGQAVPEFVGAGCVQVSSAMRV